MQNPLPILNYDLLLPECQQLLKEFHPLVNELSVLCTLKPFWVEIDGNPRFVLTQLGGNKVFFKCRDSLLFRADSLLFHLDLMQQIKFSYNTLAHEIWLQVLKREMPLPECQERHRSLGYAVSSRQTFLFDDILFNCISFFDYMAGLIRFIFHGENNHKTPWINLAKITRDKKCKENQQSFDLTESLVGRQIDLYDREFVKSLGDLRAEIIHYKMHFAKGSIVTTFDPVRTTLQVKTNTLVFEKIKGLSVYNPESELLAVAAFVIADTLRRASHLISLAQQDQEKRNIIERSGVSSNQ